MERDYLTLAQAEQAYTVKLRRYFHQHPEVGPAEQVETMAAICRELETLEIPYERVPARRDSGISGRPRPGKGPSSCGRTLTPCPFRRTPTI